MGWQTKQIDVDEEEIKGFMQRPCVGGGTLVLVAGPAGARWYTGGEIKQSLMRLLLRESKNRG